MCSINLFKNVKFGWLYENSINGSIITRLLLLPSHYIYTCLCRSKHSLCSLIGIIAWRLHAILHEIFHAIFNLVKHCIPVILKFFRIMVYIQVGLLLLSFIQKTNFPLDNCSSFTNILKTIHKSDAKNLPFSKFSHCIAAI